MMGDWLFKTAMVMAAFAVLVLIGLVAWYIYALATDQICSTTFECRNAAVMECVRSEGYTRNECIELVGGGK
jgi:uncharacterized membrane protein